VLRAWFAFEPGDAGSGIGDALALWMANLRVAGFVLLATLAARARRLVTALDLLVAACLTVNLGLVGLALGAYGPRLLPWLAHVPLEWAALAVVLTAYRHARRASPGLLQLARAGATAAALLALAAAVEAWATPLPPP